MKKIFFIIFILILFFTEQACSQEISNLRLNGFIEVENKTYFEDAGPDITDNGRNQVLLLLKAKASSSEKTKVFSSIEIRDDQINPDRDRTYIKEAFINYAGETYDLRIGKQIYAWGKADGINPTNNLNPVDYSDLMDTDEEEIGISSLSVKYYKGDWTLEGIVMPVFEQSILPPHNSRWNMFPDSLSALPVKVNKPETQFSNTQFAVKASASHKGWDYSFSYYKGFEKLPEIFIDIDTNSVTSSVRLDYKRLQVAGTDFATSFDKLGIRGEAAYFITDDNPYLFYVLGSDYNFSNLIGEQDLYIICQWVQTITIPDRNKDSAGEDNMTQIFRKAIMLKLDWKFTDYTKLEIQGIGGLNNNDIFLQPMLSSNLADSLNLETGVDLFYGDDDAFYGRFKDNQRVFVRMRYDF